MTRQSFKTHNSPSKEKLKVILGLFSTKKYWCTEDGDVISNSVWFKNLGPTKLKARVNRSGYKYVAICDGKKAWHYTVHQLVWLFFNKRAYQFELNHRDGDKLNNKLENLEEATRSQNAKHAYDSGLMCPPIWTKWSKQLISDVKKYSSLGMPNNAIAKELSITTKQVWTITKREYRHEQK